jgi:DNA-binding NarL/FixJ family response regulator
MRVLLADDHALFREGLRLILERAGHEVAGEAADGHEACKLARTLHPDIAVLDLSMPLLNGIDVARELRRLAPGTKAILLTMYPDRAYVLRALKAGAKGYVLKSQVGEDLVRAIREVSLGEVYLSAGVAASVVEAYLDNGNGGADPDPLTPRERQVLQLVAEGNSTKKAAKLLSISLKTAESHRYRIMKKLNIHDVVGLVRHAVQLGLVRI